MHIYYPTKQDVNTSRPFAKPSGEVIHFRPGTTDSELVGFEIYPVVLEAETASGTDIEYALSNGVVTKKTPAPTLAEVKADKFTELGDARGVEEESGIDVGGIPVRTDMKTEFSLEAGRNKGGRNPNLLVRWKLSDGTFTDLSLAQIEAMHDAVFEHTQDLFQKESDLTDLVIAASTIEEVRAITWN